MRTHTSANLEIVLLTFHVKFLVVVVVVVVILVVIMYHFHYSSSSGSSSSSTNEMLHHCGASLNEQRTTHSLICHGTQQN